MRSPDRPLTTTGLVSSYLCLTLDLFMLQSTAGFPVHEYTNICVWACEALPNRALQRVNFLYVLHYFELNLSRLTIT